MWIDPGPVDTETGVLLSSGKRFWLVPWVGPAMSPGRLYTVDTDGVGSTFGVGLVYRPTEENCVCAWAEH